MGRGPRRVGVVSPRAVLVPLAALALGFCAALALQPDEAAPRAAGGADLAAELRALARAQERTASVLERLESSLELARPGPPGPTRIPAGAPAPPDSLPELIADLDELRRTIAEESRLTREALRSAPLLGGEGLTEVRDRRRDPDWQALDRLLEAWRRDPRAADRSQYFQTARDLLETYGPPTRIFHSQEALLFHYRRHPEGETGPEWYFRLQDGMVIELQVQNAGDGSGD